MASVENFLCSALSFSFKKHSILWCENPPLSCQELFQPFLCNNSWIIFILCCAKLHPLDHYFICLQNLHSIVPFCSPSRCSSSLKLWFCFWCGHHFPRRSFWQQCCPSTCRKPLLKTFSPQQHSCIRLVHRRM